MGCKAMMPPRPSSTVFGGRDSFFFRSALGDSGVFYPNHLFLFCLHKGLCKNPYAVFSSLCREVGLTGQLGQSIRLGGKSRIRGHGDLISWKIRRFHSISVQWQGRPRRGTRSTFRGSRPSASSGSAQPDRYPAGPPSGGVSTAKTSTTAPSRLAF